MLQLIDHCLELDGGELTPSDLGDDELTLEELDKLMEISNKNEVPYGKQRFKGVSFDTDAGRNAVPRNA
ncbi:hypothetical protein PO124_23680 [Bacillus licheniformis]|nr:hypothetical protein [Bacillus licheniformis]